MMAFSMSWMVGRIPCMVSQFRDICHQYTEYVARKYKDAIVVFDGHENMNTKISEVVKRKEWNTFACSWNILLALNFPFPIS